MYNLYFSESQISAEHPLPYLQKNCPFSHYERMDSIEDVRRSGSLGPHYQVPRPRVSSDTIITRHPSDSQKMTRTRSSGSDFKGNIICLGPGISIKYIPGTNNKEVIFKDMKITCSEARVSTTNKNTIEITTKNCLCILAVKPSPLRSSTGSRPAPSTGHHSDQQKHYVNMSSITHPNRLHPTAPQPPPLPPRARRLSLPVVKPRSQSTNDIDYCCHSAPRSSSNGGFVNSRISQKHDLNNKSIYATPSRSVGVKKNLEESFYQPVRESFANLQTQNTPL